MKIFISIFFTLSVIMTLQSQTYLMSDGGTVSTCGGTFYDSGGVGSDYQDNENDTISFCSNNNSYITVNITSMSIRNGDYLYVYYGTDIDGTPDITNPAIGLITSSCGCISFVFISNNTGVRPGWIGTIACTAPSALVNDYLINATVSPLDGSCLIGESNIGATSDYSSGCFTSGNTVWYGFSLTAGNNTIDVTLQNATFANVEYLLLYGSCSGLSEYPTSAQCVASGSNIQWTDLTEGYYYLGISSTTEGTFDLCISESYTDVCGDYYCGPGESCLTCPFDCGACPEAIGGPYFHPTTGIQDTYLGMCMVSTCTGSYYDNGGPGITYSDNINQIYRTFCPNTPSTAVQATINSLDIEYSIIPFGCKDVLSVQNGPTQNSTVIWSGCGNTSIPQIITNSGAYSSTFTSTHPSGCLTFRFSSDAGNIGYLEGWDISLNCVAFAGGPDGTYNYDCHNAIPLCDDIDVSSEVWGPGLTSEGCGGCVTSENFTEWYRFEVSTGGTVELEITPIGNSDMNFAIYQSNDCNNLGSPIRCSFAAYSPPGKTGLSTSVGDISENVNGDQWVAELNVIAGEEYFIMINEWDKTNPNSYSLRWALTNGATFDCTILPVGFLSFSASAIDESVELIWRTASELNNDYFTLERSYDGESFEAIAFIDGAGNSNEIKTYTYTDNNPGANELLYRIKQTDFDGAFSYSNVISINLLNDIENLLEIFPNPASDILNISADVSLFYKMYRIYNVAGELITSGIIDKSQIELNVSEFAEGMYYLTLGGNHKEVFIVTRSK